MVEAVTAILDSESNLEYITIQKKGIFWNTFDPKEPTEKLLMGPNEEQIACFNKFGDKLIVGNSKGLSIFDCYKLEIIGELLLPELLYFELSPLSNYIVTFQKYVPDQDENMKIIDLHLLQIIIAFSSRRNKLFGEYFEWSKEEKYFAIHLKINEVEIYNTDSRMIEATISIEKLLSMKFGPEYQGNYLFGLASVKGNESETDFYSFPKVDKRKFYIKSAKKDGVSILYSNNGSGLLVWSENYEDPTGKSYYGEHCLHYCKNNGSSRQIVPTNGAIYDIKWNPNSSGFIVISGQQPASVVLYNNEGAEMYSLGNKYRNTIRFNELGTLVMIAGFGNLSGETDFWDIRTQKLIGSTKEHCTVLAEWGGNGRIMIFGVLYPRMKVENEYKILKYNGQSVHYVNLHKTELYDIKWRPILPGTYKERPLTPGIVPPIAQPKKTLKGLGRSDDFSKFMEAKMSGGTKPKTLVHTADKSKEKKYPPGFGPPPDEKKKKKKRKGKKKEDEQDEMI